MENIKRIFMLLMAAVMLVMMPVCALADGENEPDAVENTETAAEETTDEASEEPASEGETEEATEEPAEKMNFLERFTETGWITVMGMLGIFAVMIVIYIVITVLNKVTK